ncbi:MAG: hypothetical protein ACRD4S_12660 [Candidatus Acidiferrales bacterium]
MPSSRIVLMAAIDAPTRRAYDGGGAWIQIERTPTVRRGKLP